ncbi:hypothetical protein [Aestuariibacter salexigens]|uniref:hypothetical protein n=1 Tax=Aestuariibacter salexigens TaxID=226010 RepID=UPI0004283FC7|nr:hypothetical protein [Aestuariibacter salexigens]
MKSLVDIHVVLATASDLEDDWDEQADEAADRLNTILHMAFDRADEDISVTTLENVLQFIWENWRNDKHLLDIDDVDLSDWVDHLLATWDDEEIE